MNKNNNGIFSLRLLLSKGFHQYKFKVDEKWEFSKNHPKFEENGIINNYIDTTDYETENEKNNNNNIEIKPNEKKETKEHEKTNKKVNINQLVKK